MEVQILSICPSANVRDIKRAIADVLHTPDFQEDGSPLMNFEVFLFPAKDEDQPRKGALTLPSADIGDQFLQDYGGSPANKTISVGWYDLEFRKSGKDPRPAILKKIMTTPYIDPQDEDAHKQLEEDLRTRVVSVRAVQFGWECRDGAYSVEYEKPCHGLGKLAFDGQRREFRVRVLDADAGSSIIVVIRAAQIAWASVHQQSPTQPVLFLTLHWPPTYEFEATDETAPASSRKQRKPPRRRLAAFDHEHAMYSMYTSHALRFVCDEANALDNLLWLCKHARVKRNRHVYPVAHPRRGLFAPHVQAEYRGWLVTERWELAFQVDSLARNNVMDLQEILSLRPQLARMAADKDVEYLAAFVRHLAREARNPTWYRGAASSKDALKELFIRCRKEFAAPPDTTSPDGIADGTHSRFQCYHAIVTPSTVRLEGPFPEQCNRVIRKYAKHTSSFLRVRFTDEARLQFRSDREVDCRTFIHQRFGNVLRRGLVIAGRHFNFLGYTQASLKEHTAWFVSDFKHRTVAPDGTTHEELVTADTIIAGLGVFDEIEYDPELMLCPARYGARLAQCFSSTSASVTIDLIEIEVIRDILDASGTRQFTDGIGTISGQLAGEIWVRLCAASGRAYSEPGPRRFQIRIQGAKGMVSVDHELEGRKLCLRPSMIKFYAENSRMLEVADAFIKPSKFYLNRPLVMLLEELDIVGGYDFLEFLQQSVVDKTEAAVDSLWDAADLFDDYNLGGVFDLSTIFRELHSMGVTTLGDSFSQTVLSFGIHHVLRDLRYRARIPVPNGWNLVGVADIHGFLDEGEIFACIIPYEGQQPIYLKGHTLVSRSPVIHRGDVQVAWAVGPPPPGSPFEIEPLHSSIVFSTKGTRPLPSCLGGGDLDGDEFVCSDLAAMLPQVLYEPAEYGKGERKTLDQPSTRLDVADFLTEYLYSDTIGLIATNWLALMDQSPPGVLDPESEHEHREALEVLAELHSKAVDYPKTGMPVNMQEIPRSTLNSRPDWSAPEIQDGDTRVYYESQRWVGRLYRKIHFIAPDTSKAGSKKSHSFPSIDKVIEIFNENKFPKNDPVAEALRVRVAPHVVSPYRYSRKRIEPVWDCFRSYVTSLRTLCTTFSIVQRHAAMLSEEEVVLGTIAAQTNQPHMRKERMAKMRDHAGQLVWRTAARMVGSEPGDRKEVVKRAWIAFRVSSMQADAFGSRSFGLIASRELLAALRELEGST
ncbi:RNA dependent RNA polymerase [Phanerochaete sordida]|uniref:RNA-dependent RNA polymerase n=1 Tax=Phanerochaete sordida TaxID=48140 RepID=A0A9P3GA76_9APHY|nr:RNA dependent RNA polymerase [Phanerochaete sordida]